MVNTLLLAGIGVNVKMFLAFLLSGFFMQPNRWIKALLVLYMLPWALPALPASCRIHWMLIGYGGFLNSALEALFGIDGPIWFNWYRLALGSEHPRLHLEVDAVLDAGLPGRADGDPTGHLRGGSGGRRHRSPPVHLRDIPAAGEPLSGLARCSPRCGPSATSPRRISSPAARRRLQTEVLATYRLPDGVRPWLPQLGIAAVMSALPVLIPLAILLMRRLQATEVQL